MAGLGDISREIHGRNPFLNEQMFDSATWYTIWKIPATHKLTGLYQALSRCRVLYE